MVSAVSYRLFILEMAAKVVLRTLLEFLVIIWTIFKQTFDDIGIMNLTSSDKMLSVSVDYIAVCIQLLVYLTASDGIATSFSIRQFFRIQYEHFLGARKVIHPIRRKQMLRNGKQKK